MSMPIRKYILATSLVWAAALASLLIILFWHTKTHSSLDTGPPPPLASAPVVSDVVGTSAPSQHSEAPLSPVLLTAEQMQSIGVMTGTAEYKQLTDDLRATGNVAINEGLVSYVQMRFSGYIRKVFVNATYQYVRKGQPLFTIYSPDLVATQEQFLFARENQRALSGSSIPDVAAGARSLSTAAERRLEQWEIPEDEIAELKRSGKVLSDLTIQSPVSGYIIERNALPNLYAEPATRLYTIADLSRVWVNAQVFQNDVGRLKPGDAAAITVDAYPQKTFSGRVEQVLPQVDMTTRTVQVRLSIENSGLLLKPGMFVNVDLKSSLGRRLVIPVSAVFQTGLKQVVFLNKGNGRIEPKEVVLGPQVGDDFVVLKGLNAHQAIIISSNFLIDSESQLQGASGPSLPPSGASASPGTTLQQSLGIELTTNPNPPHKGSNVIHVNVTANNGTPVPGAEVTVTFFMPAMPTMGMAAMQATTELTNKTGGLYEGTVELASGGTWEVNITVKQNGQLVATKQLRVNAEGGM
jgi:Cu(I)/Ag(I) efflux system membrane fusion protein/cobalt-zinc-cadmium efflux system membrane fusion protein